MYDKSDESNEQKLCAILQRLPHAVAVMQGSQALQSKRLSASVSCG
ncbi:MAG: divergent polysaccharide deacetylase family protein [Ruminococcaceae bacterium]|nr:divergent polysaccharide deacetylase family protein [Oscillospiraceae bacterium]